MPDTALLALVVDRLAAEPPADGTADVVLASFQDAAAVDAALRGDTVPATVLARDAVTRRPPATYLTSIEVEGFRGIGPPSSLGLEPGPGLTLVLGRNGSGKSSFSEALEMLLLGSNKRWEKRPKVWVEGWRNLHHADARITARFTVEGRRQPLELTRRWGSGAALDASALLVDKRTGSLEALGWRQALAAYPPLLSHHELETALDAGPSSLYDALAGILGLGDIIAAMKTLRDKRLQAESTQKDAAGALIQLRQLLEHTDDERAVTVLNAVKKKVWDIDAVERVVAGPAVAGEDSLLRRLQDLAALPVLERERINAAITELRDAHRALDKQRGTDAGRALGLAQLLQQALEVHSHAEGERCPVCGTDQVLTYRWRLHATQQMEELRAAAETARAAQRRLQDAVRAARQLVVSPPAALRETPDIGVDTRSARTVWDAWMAVPRADDAAALAAHLESHGPRLIAAVADVRQAARIEFERRQRSWRPAAQAIVQWLPLGHEARDAEAVVKRLHAAEKWLREAHDHLRDERFRPIAEAVQANWTELRQDSNVSLGELRLAGASTQRRLTLDVHVDGEPASALGVMSQGELNCLALSLFLPRASLPESPFRFVVIDDPVQAMDPAKVEGLAQVLARAARERQVVVLTHDTRLADAVRYLDLKATVVEVTRRESSVVELRRVLDPVQRYIDDAFAVAKTDGLPPEALRVIPGFCRMALEAASSLVATRRMLRQGKRYAEVERELERPTTLMMWLALALLGDADRAGDVIAHLQRQHPTALTAVRECNSGAHTGTIGGNAMQFIRSVEQLAKAMVAADAPRG